MTQTNKSSVPEGFLPLALLSIPVPGLGQILHGKVVRGASIIVALLVMVGLMLWAQLGTLIELPRGLVIVLWASIAIFWLWNVLDSVFTVRRKQLPTSQLVIIVVVFSYLLGWVVTEIDSKKFVTEFPRTFQIMSRIAWPWEVAFEREEQIVSAKADFAIPCEEGEIPDVQEPTSNDPWLSVEPTCGEVSNYTTQGFEPGTEITLRGGNFAPESETNIWWEDPIGNEFRPAFDGERVKTVTDENGEFEITFYVPQVTIPSVAVGVQMNTIEARQTTEFGRLYPTENFRLAFARLIETIFLALMATSFGIIMAIPISFFAARNLMERSAVTLAIYYVVRGMLNIFRSIEPLIWAMIGVAWVGLGPFAGVIALTVHSVAALGKLYSEAIESIDPGPIEAVQATGASWIQVIVFAVIPQVVPPFMSFTIYRWDINVRMSTIIGAVGGGGIGFLLFQWIRLTDWDTAGIAVWMIAVTVMILDYASAELRKRFI